jgi:UDP-glucose 4-epimerase
MTIHEIAAVLGKTTIEWPASVLKTALAVGSTLGVSRYGPEQLDFLRYRPVLLNAALKTRFGYVPRKASREAFDSFVAARKAQGRPITAT